MAYSQPYSSASGIAPTMSAPPYPAPMAVVGPQYCCPYVVDLAIIRKVMTVADKFTVMDINGNIVFKLQASLLTLHDHRVLLDAAQNPVVTLRRKVCQFVHNFMITPFCYNHIIYLSNLTKLKMFI